MPQQVTAAGPGASLCIASGLHRLTTPVIPLEGQTLTFEKGSVLSGAQRLTGWRREGRYWVVEDQTQTFSDEDWLSNHICEEDPTDCVFEDVFLDDKPLDHVGSLAEVGPGKVFFDKTAARIYLGDDPGGRDVEATILTMGIESDADDVTIRGATIEKVGWMGLRALGDGWTLDENEIRYSHSTGLRIAGKDYVVRRNHVHHSGNTGVVATYGSDLLFEENELAHNNYLGFGMKPIPLHEGGAKFLEMSDVELRNNYSHHNDGDGWWFDSDNIDIVVQDNIFAHNTRYGFFYEVSSRATIRNNVFRNNGTDPGWSGSGMRVTSSADVEIANNLFDLNRYSSLFVNTTERGSGPHGTYRVQNLHVHDNVFRMDEGWVGSAWGETEISQASMNNRFENNAYLVDDPEGEWWIWRPDGFLTWSAWQERGFDVGGSLEPLAADE